MALTTDRNEMMSELRARLSTKQVTMQAARSVRKPADLICVIGRDNEHLDELSPEQLRMVLIALLRRSCVLKPAARREHLLREIRKRNRQLGDRGVPDLEEEVAANPNGIIPAISADLLTEFWVRTDERTTWPMTVKDLLVQDGLSGATRRLGHFAYWLTCNGEEGLPAVLKLSEHTRRQLLDRYCEDVTDIDVEQLESLLKRLADNVSPIRTAMELSAVLEATSFPDPSMRWPGDIVRRRTLLASLARYASRMPESENVRATLVLRAADNELEIQDRLRL
jgi:hypothetical protein